MDINRMSSSIKAFCLILSLIITGCGGNNDDANNLASDRSAEAELSITIKQELFDSITPIKQYILLYNISGQKLSETYDANNDGIKDSRNNYYYDSENSLEIITRDSDGDGILNSKTVFSNGDLGSKESQYYDYDSDGIFDRIIVLVRGEYGYPTFSESYDNNGDGNFNEITTYEYDEANNRISTSYDYDGDGIIDEAIRVENSDVVNLPQESENANIVDRSETYSYNSDGNLISIIRDYTGDGVPNSIDIYSYNDQGQLLNESHTYEGIQEHITLFEYDEFGNNSTTKTISKYSGTTLTKFNASGRKTDIEFDSNSDGNIDRELNYTYSGNLNILSNVHVSEFYNWD